MHERRSDPEALVGPSLFILNPENGHHLADKDAGSIDDNPLDFSGVDVEKVTEGEVGSRSGHEVDRRGAGRPMKRASPRFAC